MAIAFDTSTENYSSSASSQSFSHTCASGSSLIVFAGNRDQGAPTAVTYNGVSFDESYVNGQQGAYVWRTPATGANTVSITYGGTGAVSAHCISLTGVDTDYVLGATKLVSGSGTDINASITTWRDNSMVLGFVVNGATNDTFTPDSSQTEREEGSPGANHSTVSGTIAVASANTAQSMDWTSGVSQSWNQILIEVLADGETGQITRRNTSEGYLASGTSVSFSHEVSTNSTLLLVGFENVNDTSVTSVVFNGSENLTRIVRSDAFSGRREVWGLLNPTATTANIVITFGATNATFAGSADYANTDSSSLPTVTEWTNLSAGSSLTENITTTEDDSWLFAMVECNNGNIASTSGDTLLEDDFTELGIGENRRAIFDTGGSTGTAGSKTMSWSCDANSNGGCAVVAIEPAVVAAGIKNLGLTGVGV